MIHRRRRYRLTTAEQQAAQRDLDTILATSGRRLNLCIVVGIATLILFTTLQRQIAVVVPDEYRTLVGAAVGLLPFVWALVLGIGQEIAVHRLFNRLAATASARTGSEPRMSEADLTVDSLPISMVTTGMFVAVIGGLAWWLG